ncbi:hypothetical protein TNCV_1682181 [Trichonephila clavipes]|nr:hypothetical protein TNCV_1682181 [Trichonephila clavipes]
MENLTGTPRCTICQYAEGVEDFQNKKWYGKRKKTALVNPRKNIALNPERECSVYRRTLFLPLLKRPAEFTIEREPTFE